MADQLLMDRAEHAFYKTYNRFPVVFDHGRGVRLYDAQGREYLDFGAGIGVMGLGYGDEEYTKAVETQLHKLTHCSNLFYNQPSVDAGEKLLKAAGMDKVFFTNSGTEAIEGALKIARRCHYNKLCPSMGPGWDGNVEMDLAGEIVAMNRSFHGRSLGALSVTGNPHYQSPFGPLLPGVRFADFNNLDSVKRCMSRKTCAVVMETIQGEGGIYPAEEEFLKGVRALCDEYDALLILDEIQCGMGRSGEMFAWQHYGVKPDVMTAAKALGNGLPIGAFLAWGRAAEAMKPGDHGTTYGGNPLVTAGAVAVLDLYEKRGILDHVRKIGGYLAGKLDEIVKEYDGVKERRGMGLIQGLEFTSPVGPVVSNALVNQGLVLISAGAHVIRFVPPLVISEADVDEMARKLKGAIEAAV